MRCSAHAPAATTSAAKFAQPRGECERDGVLREQHVAQAAPFLAAQHVASQAAQAQWQMQLLLLLSLWQRCPPLIQLNLNFNLPRSSSQKHLFDTRLARTHLQLRKLQATRARPKFTRSFVCV